jgi:hypothetical protein
MRNHFYAFASMARACVEGYADRGQESGLGQEDKPTFNR